ncbi:hypothetical protein EMGBD4_11200 [Verrucomicrobiota bacterium]|nr:hypothetical protein EMGBD4_11200 [Verrucomicrobiota bacterium]
MLAASTLAMVAFSRFNHKMDGAIFVFFVITPSPPPKWPSASP